MTCGHAGNCQWDITRLSSVNYFRLLRRDVFLDLIIYIYIWEEKQNSTTKCNRQACGGWWEANDDATSSGDGDETRWQTTAAAPLRAGNPSAGLVFVILMTLALWLTLLLLPHSFFPSLSLSLNPSLPPSPHHTTTAVRMQTYVPLLGGLVWSDCRCC